MGKENTHINKLNKKAYFPLNVKTVYNLWKVICNITTHTAPASTTWMRLSAFKRTNLCCSACFFSTDKLHIGKREVDVGNTSHNSPFRDSVSKFCFQRESTSENLTELPSTGILLPRFGCVAGGWMSRQRYCKIWLWTVYIHEAIWIIYVHFLFLKTF